MLVWFTHKYSSPIEYQYYLVVLPGSNPGIYYQGILVVTQGVPPLPPTPTQCKKSQDHPKTQWGGAEKNKI